MTVRQNQDGSNHRGHDAHPKASFWHAFRPGQDVIFFALFTLYFVYEIDVSLLYHGAGLIGNFPTFYMDWDFLARFLAYPGGLVEGASAFLAQLFYHAWAGAAVVTIQAWLFSLCTDGILKAMHLERWRILRFAPPLLLLVMYSSYTFFLPMTVGCLAAMAGVCLYAKWKTAGDLPGVMSFLLISICLYVAAGGAYLLFAVLCVLSELLFNRRWRLGMINLSVGIVLPYGVGVLLYRIRCFDAYLTLLPASWKDSTEVGLRNVYALYAILPGVLALFGIWRCLFKGSKRYVSPRSFWCGSQSTFGWNFQTLVLMGLTTGTVMFCRNPYLKTLFQVDYYSHQRQWSKVLELVKGKPYHYLVCHAVDRALYQTGQLGSHMFHFPQNDKALLLTGKEALWQKFDTYMDLGLINEAENALMICIEMYGERPILLQRLAKINMIKGNLSDARVYLGALSRVPFWRDQAGHALAKLTQDPDLSEDQEIQRLRALMLRTDFVTNRDAIALLLKENPRNHMAYEYRMAWLLMNRKLDDFMVLFEQCHALNASRIPRHYEEAILLSRSLKNQPIKEAVSQDAQKQLLAFVKALKGCGRDKALAKRTLKGPYGDSYLYYYFLGGSGAS